MPDKYPWGQDGLAVHECQEEAWKARALAAESALAEKGYDPMAQRLAASQTRADHAESALTDARKALAKIGKAYDAWNDNDCDPGDILCSIGDALGALLPQPAVQVIPAWPDTSVRCGTYDRIVVDELEDCCPDVQSLPSSQVTP